MKILFIHNIIAPYRSPLFEELSKVFDIHVIFLEKNDSNRKWDQDSRKLKFNHTFLNNKTYKIFGKTINLNYGLKKEFNKINPEILVTLDNPNNFLTIIQSVFLAKNKKIPIVLWTGAFDNYLVNNNGIKKMIINLSMKYIRKYIYKNTNYFWAYSEGTKEYLEKKFNIKSNKIIIGLQGYPDLLIPFNKLEIDLKKRFENNKLLFIGYLDNRKGINTLIDAFNKICVNYPNYSLEIIGSGFLYEELFNKYSNKKISFLGYKDGLDKFKKINESKFFILPSYSDPWGWVVNEATSLKVPSIVTQAVMSKEMIKNSQCIFDTGSSDDLSIKLEKLFRLNYDEYVSLSEEMYSNSRKHTLDKSINSFLKIIKEINK